MHRSLRRRTLFALATFSLLASGCAETLKTQYGDPKGDSINGVAGFVELVKSKGHRTQIWRNASPNMEWEFDAIVMFHTDYEKVPKETLRNVRDMMREGTIGTLLIVIRDSDGAIDYWRQVIDMPSLSKSDKAAAEESLKESMSELKLETTHEFEADFGEYYGLKRVDRKDSTPTIPVQIGGEEPVIINARWPLNRRMEPAPEMLVLWSTGDEPLLLEEFDDEMGEVLVLANAAPILNGGLVDPGNRQLAEELVNRLPEEGRVAIVLSSRWSDGKFADSPSMFEFLKVHPHGWIFGQTVLALALFCWWKLPIFRRPRIATNSETVRFGRHIEALGTLLQKTGDSAFARRIVRDWQRAESRRGSDKLNDKDQDATIDTNAEPETTAPIATEE